MSNYHELKNYISASGLKKLAKSPAHFLEWINEETKDTEALRFGRMYHSYVLEPMEFKKEFVPFFKPDPNKTMGAKINKEHKEYLEQSGKTIVTEDEMLILKQMRDVLMKDENIKKILTGGVAEKEFYIEDYNGIQAKCKPDYLTDKVIVDIKTTTSSDPRDFVKQAYKLGYHIQAGHYHNLIGGDREFVFIAQEKTSPFVASVFVCSDEFLEVGKRTANKLIEVLKECKKTGVYQGYTSEQDNNIFTLDLPNYAE